MPMDGARERICERCGFALVTDVSAGRIEMIAMTRELVARAKVT